MIDGIVKYILPEFKEGVTNTYLNQMEKRVGEIGELRVLFPETYDFLLRRDPFSWSTQGTNLRGIFNKDISNSLDNLMDYINQEKIEDSKYKDFKFKFLNSERTSQIRQSDAYFTLNLAKDISTKLIDGYHPVDLMNYLDRNYYKTNTKDTSSFRFKVGQICRGLNAIQSAFRDTTKSVNGQFDNVWIGFEQLKELDTKRELKYFAALIYWEEPDFFHFLKEMFDSTNISWDQQAEILFEELLPIYQLLIKLQEFPKEANQNEKRFDVLLDLMFEIIENTNNLSDEEKIELSNYEVIIKRIVNVFQSIAHEHYENLMDDLIVIVEQLLPNEKCFLNPEFVKILSFLNNYGEFMTGIVNASDSDEAKEVIAGFVAPPKSFIQKRSSIHSLSISAHPGVFTGVEWYNENTSVTSGLTLPIGVEWSMGLTNSTTTNSKSKGRFINKKGDITSFTGHSVSIFAQLLDLGAILDFRISDNESELPNEVSFRQILSPGIMVNYGVKNSPVTIGLGYQRGPKLRKLGEDFGSKNSNRFIFRCTWDIPLVSVFAIKG